MFGPWWSLDFILCVMGNHRGVLHNGVIMGVLKKMVLEGVE